MIDRQLRRFGTALALVAALAAPLPAAWAAPVLPKQHGNIAAEDWQSVETENTVIFFTDNSPAREDLAQIKELLEQDVDKVATLLQVRLPHKINVILYPDRFKAPRQRWGLYLWGDEGDIRTIHVTYDDQFRRRMPYKGGASDLFLGGVTAAFALVLNPEPSYLFAQGLALYVADLTYPGGPLEAYVKKHMEDGKVPSLEQIDQFSEEEILKRGQPVQATPGTFARFLIRNYGFEMYMQAYRKSRPKLAAAAVQDVYGKSLATLDGEFRAYIKGFILPRTRPDKDRAVD